MGGMSGWSRRTKAGVGRRFSRGAQLLAAALQERGWSQTKLKREMATDHAISHWLYGERRPGLEAAIHLRDLLGIPVDAWVEPAAETSEAAA